MQVKRSFTVFLIISFLNSSVFTIGCATTYRNASEAKQEGEGNVMVYKSDGTIVNKGQITINNPPPEPSFWQNPWLWTVIVGVGAAVYFSQKKEDPKPTDQPTQGYIGINW